MPLTVTAGKTERLVDSDEQPPKARLDKIPTLKPAFREGGTVTAANSSSISDGAAALVLMRLSEAERRGLAPLAAIRGHASFADAPNLFPTAPVGAVKRLMQRTGWSLGEVDLFEVNEAFAVVGMAAMRDLDLSHERLNVHGGAWCAGPSDRRVRRADRRDPAQRPAAVRPGTRRGGGLHRRRRGDRDRRRALALMQAVKKRNPR